ncbi:MAG: hypothetical protein RL660_2814, partial [Bacteroidota bacterium]
MLVLLQTHVYGQVYGKAGVLNLSYNKISNKDGLLNDAVQAIAQDASGFMWFGGYGLQRYDGHKLKTFLTTAQVPVITYITPDNSDNLYIGGNLDQANVRNLYCFNTTTNKLYKFPDSIVIRGSKVPLHLLHPPLCAPDGTIWLALKPSSYGIIKPGTKQIEIVSNTWPLKGNITYRTNFQLIEGRYIWQANTEDGVYCVDIASKCIINASNSSQPIFSVAINKPISCTKTSNEEFWIISNTNDQIATHFTQQCKQRADYRFPYQQQKGKSISTYLQQIVTDRHGDVWLIPGERVGIAKFNNQTSTFDYQYTSTANDKALFDYFDIGEAGVSVFFDKQNNLWYPGAGVLMASTKKPLINNISTEEIVNAVYSDTDLLPIAKHSTPSSIVQMSNGDVFVSYYGAGLVKFDSSMASATSIKLPASISPLLWQCVPINDKQLIISEQNGKLYSFDTRSQQVRHLNSTNSKMLITTYCKVQDGMLCGLYDGSLQVLLPNATLGKKYHVSSGQGAINSLYASNNYVYIACTNGSLHKLDLATGSTTQVYKQQSSGDFEINDISSYKVNALLLSTTDGMQIFNTIDNTLKPLQHQGIAQLGTCFSAQYNAIKKLWYVATAQHGLCSYNPETNRMDAIQYQAGNTTQQCAKANILLAGGDLLFARQRGLYHIPPAASTKLLEWPVHLCEFTANGTDMTKAAGKRLEVDSKAGEISIAFGNFNYAQSSTVQYETFLQGLDTAWQVNRSNTINLKGLRPGHYALNVRYHYGDGNYSASYKIVRFSILPPLYQRWWFMALVLLASIAIIYWYMRKRNKQALAAQALETKALKGQLELEQVSNYFSVSLTSINDIDTVLQDVANNLIHKLDFDNCTIYLWNADKTILERRAGKSIRGEADNTDPSLFNIAPKQGFIGAVAETATPLLISDTSKDPRYITFDAHNLSEVVVPIIYNHQVLGVINCEHPEANYYTEQHSNMLQTIATITANKIKAVEAQQQVNTQQQALHEMKERLLQVELEALRSQMNPHFIFNSLNSINGFIVENNTKQASAYLTKFAKLIRLILDNSKQNEIPLSKEIEALRIYIALEAVRFRDKFSSSFEVDDNVNQDQFMLPPTSLQPYVENAIWH